MVIEDGDFHDHLKARMAERGITRNEIQEVLNNGWDAPDAKPGTFGKVPVLGYNKVWQGPVYEEKEVRVYYKSAGARVDPI
jgi:hypothetical protein